MAFRYSPKIVTDGLVLYLDAANTKSYPRSGTIWSDISRGGNNGTLINGPVFSGSNGGIIVFDGVDDYCSVPNQTFNSTGSGSFTIEVFFKRNSSTPVNADSLYFMGNGGATDARIYFWFDNNNNGQMAINYYAGVGYDAYITLAPQLLDTNFHHAVQIVDKSTNQMTGYFDGINKGTASTLANSYTTTTNFNICGTNYCDASIGLFRIYNRALSSQEILQNYTTTKTRFGL
jgi:hypothetical protein